MIDIALNPCFVQDAHLQTNHHSPKKDNDLPHSDPTVCHDDTREHLKASNGRSKRQLLIRKEEKL